MTPPRKWARVPAPVRIEEWLAAEHMRITGHPIRAGSSRLLHWRAVVWFSCHPGLDVSGAELYRLNNERTKRRDPPKEDGLIGHVLAGGRRFVLYVRERRLRSPTS